MVRRISVVATLVVVMAGLSAARGAEPDLSTPKAAALAFVQALANGDAAAAKAVATADDRGGQMVDAMAELVKAMKALKAAAVAKWPGEGQNIVEEDIGENLLRHFRDERAQAKVEGETATFGTEDETQPLKLRRLDGKWKVDLAAMGDQQDIAEALPLIRAMAKAAPQVAADITAGKYKSVDDARAALDARMTSAVEENQKK